MKGSVTTTRASDRRQGDAAPLRFLFALPGFHAEERGAEVALLSVADALARTGDAVTVVGTGPERDSTAYA